MKSRKAAIDEAGREKNKRCDALDGLFLLLHFFSFLGKRALLQADFVDVLGF
jgi:hypothetical protein